MDTPNDPHTPESERGHRSEPRALPDPGEGQVRLARFMFDLQADSYDADDEMRELAWEDGGVREFWFGQAGAVVSFLALEAA